jgi:hypothetical protein
MDLEMVLNELSLQPPANDKVAARQRMIELVETLSTATRLGVKRVLRTHRDLKYEELGPDYLVANWMNDNGVDREARRYFLNLATKAPYLVDVADSTIEDRADASDFFFEEDRALGLGAAFLLDSLAISFRSTPRWHFHRLGVKWVQLDDEGEIIDEMVEVLHACSKDHVLEHAEWIRKRLSGPIRDGSDLWERREILFPNLQFCESVAPQLSALRAGDPKLHFVEKKLSELEQFCHNWQKQEGKFDYKDIPGRGGPESQPTLDKYGYLRVFRCPDGSEQLFTFHVRLTISWRLHYFPLSEKRQLIIGYVGEHLPTVKFPG